MNDDKEIRSDAKLKNLPREMRDDLWRMRHPEEDGEKVRFIDILAWLKGKGVDSSLASLSEYYSWERTERRMEAARARADQAGRMLASDPNATPEDVARVGQMVFTSEMVDSGNVKAFVQLEKLRLAQKQTEQDERKLDQRDQELTQRETLVAQSERRVALLEKKAEFADAVKKAAENSLGGITAEQMAEIERKLKLL
jgi:ribosomal protein L9